MSLRLGIVIVVVFMSSTAFASSPLETWFEEHQSLNQNGMLVLGSWALANFAVSTPGWFLTDKGSRWHYVHEMNVAWNLVNAAIAAFGYAGQSSRTLPGGFGEALHEATGLESLLLLNAGLDVGYMAAGALLFHFKNDSPRVSGYGASIVAQGAFLFAFDVALYWLNSDLNATIWPLVDGSAGLQVMGAF